MTTKIIPPGAMTNALPIIAPGDLPGDLNNVVDGMFQNLNIFDAVTILQARYADDPTVHVDGCSIICYNPDNLNDRVYPDCYVAFGVPSAAIYAQNGYLIWQVGKPLDFALEVASESTARNDITSKRDLYESIGVKEYWRFDPSGGDYYGVSLAGDRAVNGAYEPIEMGVNLDGMLCGYSPLLGLSLCADESGHPRGRGVRMDRLLFYDPNAGIYLQSLSETQDDLATTQDDLAAAQARIRELEANLRRREDK